MYMCVYIDVYMHMYMYTSISISISIYSCYNLTYAPLSHSLQCELQCWDHASGPQLESKEVFVLLVQFLQPFRLERTPEIADGVAYK